MNVTGLVAVAAIAVALYVTVDVISAWAEDRRRYRRARPYFPAHRRWWER